MIQDLNRCNDTEIVVCRRRVLSDIAVWIYQGITKMMEDEIHPILVQALLEHEGIGGLSGSIIYSLISLFIYSLIH